LGLMLGYFKGKVDLPVDLVQEADRLGVHVVWTAEAYGSDAVTPLAWLGALTDKIRLGTAIMQIPGRTPANAAMTAMTLNQLSGGRFNMGLGLSGPQVVEGWHGVSYGQPLKRTREYVEIIRMIFRREERLRYNGQIYQLPYRGENAAGLGRALKSTLVAAADIPIYLAAIGPKNVALAGEIAEGWLPIFFSPQDYQHVFEPHLREGFERSDFPEKLASFDIAPVVHVVIDENLDVCWNALRPVFALYVGGMGAKQRNFYADLARRYGFEAEVAKIQDLYLSGNKGEAMMAVPTELIDRVALVGPKERIKDRLSMWSDVPVTTLNVAAPDVVTLRTMAELVT
ncbi:MAG: LLM class F420-dependent oxidoreductase, partial [Candidatus Promineifilaceae bacterium]